MEICFIYSKNYSKVSAFPAPVEESQRKHIAKSKRHESNSAQEHQEKLKPLPI
jgi:hypothetical protein